jgi:hypothetical protein
VFEFYRAAGTPGRGNHIRAGEKTMSSGTKLLCALALGAGLLAALPPPGVGRAREGQEG